MTAPAQPAENTIGLKGIADLINLNFLVPQYQRGYRWTQTQVTELLEDLLHFRSTAPPNTFYCLQPVLVKRRGDQWEVIDGQQRLTSIYILYEFIQQNYLRGGKPLFTLEYATRPQSQEFLENISAEQADNNIDFHFMYQAQASMKDWFEAQQIPSLAANNIFSVLLERTQVIWYELDPTQGGEHEAFIRINSGKIPLTNAELIKALFLKRAQVGDDNDQRRFEQRQLELATEWDMIEARLRQPELWYFLNENASNKPTRIEFLFELLASLDENSAKEKAARPDDYATFRYFNGLLQRASTEKLLDEWKKVKNLFLLLDEWYNTRDWYHQLGYLITTGTPISELVKEAHDSTKTQFKSHVLEQIKLSVAGPLEEWTYRDDYTKLRNVLLLLNIETLQQNPGASYRFPFQYYKGNGQEARRWSLEHIHAQSSQGLKGKQAYQQWLRDVIPYVAEQPDMLPEQTALTDGQGSVLTAAQVLTEIERLLEQTNIEKDDFEQVQRQIFSLLGQPEVHTIENLALLTTNDNSALSNKVFQQKRQRIIELEREGSFIPIATRNVFLKYYSNDFDHLSYWTANDRNSYAQAVRKTLIDYLTPITAPANAD
ncbi:GmrSD restriction endonuclease domain-containing protein [Hymenobacter defluvii]|uniref:DUF262 domain-containing protein n=1 Tax=Hymenobacter defluvii TaxID=2054411 RepID=A0ABS3TEC3_9BACT|nr:DUF262 domain-containing protein [Hymenobacter defluvii]MBO3272004.1 DUF262 domain-containing protein [Hymenobacter defluvii]